MDTPNENYNAEEEKKQLLNEIYLIVDESENEEHFSADRLWEKLGMLFEQFGVI